MTTLFTVKNIAGVVALCKGGNTSPVFAMTRKEANALIIALAQSLDDPLQIRFVCRDKVGRGEID